MSKSPKHKNNTTLILLSCVGILATPIIFHITRLTSMHVCPKSYYGACTLESIVPGALTIYGVTILWLLIWIVVLILRLLARRRSKS